MVHHLLVNCPEHAVERLNTKFQLDLPEVLDPWLPNLAKIIQFLNLKG